MTSAVTFKDLIVWQKAHEYVLKVYKYTSFFPKHEQFGLTSQFRRAAISIAANIVEGFKRSGIKEKLLFMNIAQASLEECRYFEILSFDLNYGENQNLTIVLNEVARLLNSYHKAISQSIPSK